MKKGFMLTECLLAAVLAGLALPPLVSGFSDYLNASLDLRQRQEAMRIAISCVDVTEAVGGAPSREWIQENLPGCLASYDVSVNVTGSGAGKVCDVTVEWPGRNGALKVSVSRQIR